MADSGYDIRQNIWEQYNDKGQLCYYVTLYDHGHPVQVEVDYVYRNGALDANGQPCVASIWEAAIRKHFGQGALNGGAPNLAWEAITGSKPLKVDENDKNVGTQALKSHGSKPTPSEGNEGTISVAGSKHDLPGADDDGNALITAKRGPNRNAHSYHMYINNDHEYEVIETKGNIIHLRNPWGYNNVPNPDKTDKDNPYLPDSPDDFWISKAQFDRMFDQESRQ